MFVNSNWSNAIAARMGRLADRGCSASMIAETINVEFGMKFTRDAVLSKSKRLGITLRGVPGREVRESRPT
jgi:hypothetical protein